MRHTIPILSEGQRRAINRVRKREKNQTQPVLRRNNHFKNKKIAETKPFRPKEPWNDDFASPGPLSDQVKCFIGFDRNGKPNPKKDKLDFLSNKIAIRKKALIKANDKSKNMIETNKDSKDTYDFTGNENSCPELKEVQENNAKISTNTSDVKSYKMVGSCKEEGIKKVLIERCDGSPYEIVKYEKIDNQTIPRKSRGISPLRYDDVLDVINVFNQHKINEVEGNKNNETKEVMLVPELILSFDFPSYFLTNNTKSHSIYKDMTVSELERISKLLYSTLALEVIEELSESLSILSNEIVECI